MKKEKARHTCKKHLARNVVPLLALLLSTPVLFPGVSHAENIIWNGPSDPNNEPNNLALQADPKSPLRGNSLLPSTDKSGNTITVWDDVAYRVYGGFDSGSNAVTGNTVNIEAGTMQEVLGGYSETGTVSGNTVNIKGGTLTAIREGIAFGGFTFQGTAERNTVAVSGGTMDSAIGGYANGLGGVARDNAVSVSGNAVVKTVAGAMGMGGEVTNNSATISSGTVELVYGGREGNNYGAKGNAVIIEGGSITGNASSGRAVIGGYSSMGTASGNTVTINGGAIAGAIYGGFTDGGNATNNIVTITGTPDLTQAGLYGGKGNAVTGNTLNLHSPITVSRLGGFQKYNFYLPATISAGATMLTVTDGGVDGAGPVRISSSVNVGVEGDGSSLKPGDTITLIKETSGKGITGKPVNTTTSGEGMQGISQKIAFTLSTTLDSLIATITSSSANEQLKALSESREAGLGMINQGADMLATQGITQLRANAGQKAGPVAFGVMGGQSLRYNSGSHVDVNSANLVTGLGWNLPIKEGRDGNFLIGAFFEAGWGSYDSHNSFGNAASVKGDGDISYYGGGLLSRYDSPLVGPGNIYAEASVRAGRIKTEFDSSDIDSASGNKVDFDSSANYYGAHIGLGYVWDITEASTLDVYTKYLWTRQDSDSVTIEGDNIRFKTMDSLRWRTGAKFAHALTTESGMLFTPYIGAAYEHEFNSKAKATSNGNAIDTPDVEGGTGIGELGLAFKPVADKGLSFDLAAQGYTGKREGVGGSLQIKFEF